MPSVKKVNLYKDDKGEFRYSVIAGNNRVVGASEEGFAKRYYAVRRIKKHYPDVPIYQDGIPIE